MYFFPRLSQVSRYSAMMLKAKDKYQDFKRSKIVGKTIWLVANSFFFLPNVWQTVIFASFASNLVSPLFFFLVSCCFHFTFLPQLSATLEQRLGNFYLVPCSQLDQMQNQRRIKQTKAFCLHHTCPSRRCFLHKLNPGVRVIFLHS